MVERRSSLSVTRLLGLNLTPGKLRGLQRISNANGTLTMVALDQNSSMIALVRDSLERRGEPGEPTYEEIVEAKVHLTRALAPAASAVLLDPCYGAWNAVASFSLPRDVGLLVRVEKSGGSKSRRGAPLGEIEPGWSVAKIKRMGADAVKLLAPFEPTEPESAEHQMALVQKIYDDCRRHDLLMLLEAVAFPFDGEKKNSHSFRERKAETVIETARQLSRWCDVYKAEFPGHIGRDSDAQLHENVRQLNAACERPWVLLSAGVDFPEYKRQVELALRAGSCGVLGGRAFWKEYFHHDAQQARDQFALQEAHSRVRQIDQLVQELGQPWFTRYGLRLEQLHQLRATEHWHIRYHETSPAAGSRSNPAGGDVH